MTIERGRPWGRPGALPAGSPVITHDAALRELVETAHDQGSLGSIGPVGLVGGDLCRTLGGTGNENRLASEEAWTFPVDLVRVRLDDAPARWCVAHCVVRGPGWTGQVYVAMNAQWLGRWDLGPRSHPNDGLLDVTEGRLPIGDRWEAARRVRTGSHLPHPDLRTRRVATDEVAFPRPRPVRLDGVRVGRARRLRLEVVRDALEVVV